MLFLERYTEGKRDTKGEKEIQRGQESERKIK